MNQNLDIDYNFEHILKVDEIEKLKRQPSKRRKAKNKLLPNLKYVRCCFNCKWYWRSDYILDGYCLRKEPDKSWTTHTYPNKSWTTPIYGLLCCDRWRKKNDTVPRYIKRHKIPVQYDLSNKPIKIDDPLDN